MKEPLDHVRRAILPWREDDGLTECGLQANSYPTLTRDEFLAKCKRDGQRRTALTSCMTCLDRFQTYWRLAKGRTDGDVLDTLEREIQHVRHEPENLLRVELDAIVALVAAHRDEFDEYMAGRAETTDLAEARRNRDAAGEYFHKARK